MRSIEIVDYQFSPCKTKVIRVGQKVRWFQNGLNRYLYGRVINIIEREGEKPNNYQVEIKLQTGSGHVMKIRAYQLL